MLTALPWAAASEGHSEAVAFRVDVLEDRLADDDLEVAVVLIETADADFQIFVELFTVVGLVRTGISVMYRGIAYGRSCLHGADQFAIAEGVIAGELNVADLDLGAFFDFEHQDDGVTGGDAFVLGRDFRELAAMLTQQILQHHFRFLDSRGIELALDRQTDLAFLEAVEDVGFGNGVDAVVADAPDRPGALSRRR